jgi:hypothetical protein
MVEVVDVQAGNDRVTLFVTKAEYERGSAYEGD